MEHVAKKLRFAALPAPDRITAAAVAAASAGDGVLIGVAVTAAGNPCSAVIVRLNG